MSDQEQSTSAPRRVVVAEDESLIRMDIVEILRDNGFDVVGEAGDGETAVALATELRPDLVIMDIRMPQLDGIEAAKRLSENHIAPVVLLTAFSQKELVEQASEAGEELDDEPESVIKSKWFQRRKEDQIRWPKNPHFEHCPPEGDRAENDLPVECFLVEVADSDLTEGSVDVKWEAPKLKETFVKKLRALVEKYPRLKANEVPVYPTTSQAKQIGKPAAKARGPRTNRPRATSTTAQTDRKRRRRR